MGRIFTLLYFMYEYNERGIKKEMKSRKDFERDILNNDRIECNICQLTIGNAEEILKHMRKRHADIYKEFAMKASPEKYEEEMKRRV